MTRKEARTVELTVASLAEAMAKDPRLGTELVRARREFLGTDRAEAVGAADKAHHRFAEWFALERESDNLGAVPIEVEPYCEAASDLCDSIAGVFLVLASAEDSVQARDLQDERVLELVVPAGSLQQGDLLVGRLFELDVDLWTPSTAAAVFRPGQELGKAFRRDLQHLGLERRLWQIELEHLLLRQFDQSPSPRFDQAPLEHLEADLDQLLQAGKSGLSAAEVSQRLALARGPGAVMEPLLEALAFDTEVDLDKCRTLMLQIWNAHHSLPLDEAQVSSAAPAPGEKLGERLARTLEEGLRHRRDVAELFAQLERMAGLRSEDGDEPGDPRDAEVAEQEEGEDDPEGPQDDQDEEDGEDGEDEDQGDDDGSVAASGDLDPLVQEYLWETGRAGDPAGPTLRLWLQLQEDSPLPHTDFEFVTGKDLMRLLLYVYLGAPPTGRADAVRSAFAELQRFYAWAASTQEQDFRSVLDECKGPLLDQVERLQEAGIQFSTAATTNARPGILQVEDLGPKGFGVRDDDGENHWLSASPRSLSSLRVGDLLLGALARGTGPEHNGTGPSLVGLVVVLPADAKSLIE
ncbi:MAG TPA: hypothetical protein VFD82_13020 [Planctomycetota bacterium]|nr:hypothetical protein [Planctomycetota bacterium]